MNAQPRDEATFFTRVALVIPPYRSSEKKKLTPPLLPREGKGSLRYRSAKDFRAVGGTDSNRQAWFEDRLADLFLALHEAPIPFTFVDATGQLYQLDAGAVKIAENKKVIRPLADDVTGKVSEIVLSSAFWEKKRAGAALRAQARVDHTNASPISTPPSMFLFTWNPKKYSWDGLSTALQTVNQRDEFSMNWSCGNSKLPKVGDNFYFIKLGVDPRGIIGRGKIVGPPTKAAHFADRAKSTNYCKLAFEDLVDGRVEVVISREELNEPEFSGQHWDTQVSGIQIGGSVAQALDHVWTERRRAISGEGYGEEVVTTEYAEGAVKQILVNRYERDRNARIACLTHHGCSCSVCGLSMESRYGEIAREFIHVHHIVPLSKIGARYEVNPITDLKPVCPNCHAIIHRRNPPLTIDEARARMR